MALGVSPQQLAAPLQVPKSLPRLVALILACGDLTATILAGLLSFWIRSLFGPLPLAEYARMAPLLLLVPVAFLYFGLYPSYGIGAVEQLRRLVRSLTFIFLGLLSSTFLLQVGPRYSRSVVVGWWFMSLVLVPLTRALLRGVLSRTSWWGKPVVILGAARTGQIVIRRLLANPRLGLLPVACLDDDKEKQGSLCAGIPVVGPLQLAPALARVHRIPMVLVAMPGLRRSHLTQIVEAHASLYPEVLLVPDLLGLTSLWVDARDLQGVLGLELKQNLLVPWNRLLKRSLDLAVSILAILFAGPVVLAMGLIVKLKSPGPAFYYQLREGEGGRPIRVWKLRTMIPNAEAVLQQYLDNNPEARAEWDQSMKLKDDPRIVPGVGGLLRRSSIDELPQLWNILRGEMSLVGPRPFPEYHLDRFPTTFREIRRRVPPGLTGLWQVSARSDGDLGIQEELDTYYIRNWSLWLDIDILARTVVAVLARKGAY